MAETLVLEDMGAGEAVREYLLTMKLGYPYQFFKIWSRWKKRTSYEAVRRLFYVLKEIGLIRAVSFVQGKGNWKKHMYEVVPERIEDPAWLHPQVELWPDTKLGSPGYAELKKRGLKPKGGRRVKYRK